LRVKHARENNRTQEGGARQQAPPLQPRVKQPRGKRRTSSATDAHCHRCATSLRGARLRWRAAKETTSKGARHMWNDNERKAKSSSCAHSAHCRGRTARLSHLRGVLRQPRLHDKATTHPRLREICRTPTPARGNSRSSHQGQQALTNHQLNETRASCRAAPPSGNARASSRRHALRNFDSGVQVEREEEECRRSPCGCRRGCDWHSSSKVPRARPVCLCLHFGLDARPSKQVYYEKPPQASLSKFCTVV